MGTGRVISTHNLAEYWEPFNIKERVDMHLVELLKVGETQDRQGHQFTRTSQDSFKVDISLSTEKYFKQLNLQEAIEFFEKIE